MKEPNSAKTQKNVKKICYRDRQNREKILTIAYFCDILNWYSLFNYT